MVGQDHVARALGNALRSGRPAQGYLFSGPRGTGKTTTARILARCLNCQSFPAPTAEPCGTCDSCRRTGQPDWMDVVEVDAASSARRIDEMREWLETVRYAPVACRYRITIMDEAHQIQDQAASALLKTLEEPPPHLVVILCTTHPWEILGTIRSRLQHYVLRKPGLPALVKVLDRVARAEDIQTSESALDILARAADGSYRDALGLLDQIATYADNRVEASDALELLGAVARETIFELVDLMAGGDAAGGFELLETVLDGPVNPEQAMRGLVNHLRYLCLLQQGARPRDEWSFSPEEVARLQAQANQLPDAQVVRGLDLLSDAQLRIRHGGADPRLQLELVAARLARPALDASAGALAARVEALESAAPRTVTPSPPARGGGAGAGVRGEQGGGGGRAAGRRPGPASRGARAGCGAGERSARRGRGAGPRAPRPPVAARARGAGARCPTDARVPRRLPPRGGGRADPRGHGHQPDARRDAGEARAPRAGAGGRRGRGGAGAGGGVPGRASGGHGDPGVARGGAPRRRRTARGSEDDVQRRGGRRRARRPGRAMMAMNPQKMMKQMQKMQEDMQRVQTELQQESVTASAGGGAVTARVSGGLELMEITIDPEAVDPDDVELLQDVIVAAVNEAMRAAQQLAQDRLGAITGGLSGMGLPGL